MSIYHIHHKIPKHMNGSDDPSNLEKLTIEQHAEAHRILYEKYGHWQDKLAWLGLSNQIDKKEIIQFKISEGGRKGSSLSAKPWWTNGVINKRSNVKPGDEWYSGRVNNKSKKMYIFKCEECGFEEQRQDKVANRKIRFCSHKCSSKNHVKTGKIKLKIGTFNPYLI